MSLHRWGLTLAVLAAAAFCGAGGLAGQAAGSIRGKVLEENTLRPLSGVQVTVPGTARGGLTDAAGNYVVGGVPVGARVVRAQMLGYADVERSVTVSAAQAVVADFTLAQQAVSLNEIVVTGTPGAVQKKTLGNTITTINAAEVTRRSSNQTVTELLTAKTPGLTITGGSGTAGVAQSLKIRGVTSVNAGNQPVVYVDGVKIASGTLGSFVASCCAGDLVSGGSQRTDALGGIAPEDVESIEVIKGPAAATLYGADAAAGVIQIFTKKGKPGQQKLSWDAKVQYGADSWGDVEQPVNWTLCDAAKLAAPAAWPGCAGHAVGDKISQNTMTLDPQQIRRGPVQNYALAMRGGGDNYSFYIGGTYDDEQGVFYNNFSKRRSIRSNFGFNPLSVLDFTVSVGFSQQHVRLPKSDDDANGIMYNAMLIRPGRANPWGNSLQPDTANMYDNQTRASTIILGTTANYRPFPWFKNRLTVGYTNLTSQADIFYAPGRIAIKLAAGDPTGVIAEQIPRTSNYTVDYAGTLTRQVLKNVQSDLSFGMQFLANRYNLLYADGYGIASQFTRLVSSAAKTTSSQSFSETNSLGFFGQEQVGINGRIFLTAGLRMDNNSVFGADIKRIFYPKFSGSWVVSDEKWFHVSHMDNLRLRAAWGQAGKAPAAYAATRTYSSGVTTLANATSVSALYAAAYGNPKLEPERGTEIEAGFDASAFGGRAGLEFTFYNKHMTNGLLSTTVAPSTGFNSTYLLNLLNMTNRGTEATVTATPIQSKNLAWNARLNMATNHSKLISFGDNRPGSLYGDYTGVQGLWPGYPLYGYFGRGPKLDASGNVMTQNGVALAGDTTYIGPSSPTREVGFSNTITVFKNVSLFALLDYKGGHYLFDVRDWRRNYASLTEFMLDPKSDPNTVAMYKAWSGPTGFVSKPWIMPADFLKLRDVSVTYTLPQNLAHAVRTDRASVTLSSHNVLTLWTKYKGLDPESNFNGATDFIRTDGWTMPPLRRISASLNVSF